VALLRKEMCNWRHPYMLKNVSYAFDYTCVFRYVHMMSCVSHTCVYVYICFMCVSPHKCEGVRCVDGGHVASRTSWRILSHIIWHITSIWHIICVHKPCDTYVSHGFFTCVTWLMHTIHIQIHIQIFNLYSCIRLIFKFKFKHSIHTQIFNSYSCIWFICLQSGGLHLFEYQS